MRLLLDVGNTRIKWAWWADGRLTGPGAGLHRGGDAGTLAALVAELPQQPEEIRLASVAAPALVDALVAALRARFAAPLRIASTAAVAGRLRNGYRDAAQLGVDRWLALRAAQAAYPDQGCCVVDAGTAITIDCLAASGQHLGGLILPGLRLLTGLLDGVAAGLAPVRGPAPAAVLQECWATDTDSARAAGPLLAVVALVDRCAEELTARETGGVRLLLTGGDAAGLAPMLRRTVELRPLLVLEGLALD